MENGIVLQAKTLADGRKAGLLLWESGEYEVRTSHPKGFDVEYEGLVRDWAYSVYNELK